MHFPTYNDHRLRTQIGGERFTVLYKLYAATAPDARKMAEEICEEQTVEFPSSELPKGHIPDQLLGQIEHLGVRDSEFEVEISYAEELVCNEFTQFLNVIFGNSSIKPGIRVMDVKVTENILGFMSGPRYGMSGLRSILKVPNRPLISTALKPVGLDSKDLADLAGTFACSGIDIIKDDHGITNQVFSPFKERVQCCADAVQEANIKTGGHAIYVPNVTTTTSCLLDRAMYAKECGAGGVLVAPGLVSMDAIKCLADNDELALPVFSHPALLGSNVINTQGFCYSLLFGKLNRLAGADVSIFPNFGGRFSLNKQDCLDIVHASRQPIGNLRPMFTAPAGGMNIANIPDMITSYGNDFVVLIGGGLFTLGPVLADNCKIIVSRIEESVVQA